MEAPNNFSDMKILNHSLPSAPSGLMQSVYRLRWLASLAYPFCLLDTAIKSSPFTPTPISVELLIRVANRKSLGSISHSMLGIPLMRASASLPDFRLPVRFRSQNSKMVVTSP